MLLTKTQIDWIKRLTDDWQLLDRYFQLNAEHIVQEFRRKYLIRHVSITAHRLHRTLSNNLLVKYNQLRIRGGFSRGRKRFRRRLWNYYHLVFVLRRVRRSRRLASNRRTSATKYKRKEKNPKVVDNKVSIDKTIEAAATISDKSDTEFVYYQSSDDEEAYNGIINSSDPRIAPPAYVADDDNRTESSDAIESAVQSLASLAPGDEIVEEQRSRPPSARSPTTSSVEQNGDAARENGDGNAMSDSRCTRYSNDSTLEACDVSERLRQQLELLKRGKGEINLLSRRPSERPSLSRQSSSSNLTPSASRHSTGSNVSASSTPPKRLSREDGVQKTTTSSGPSIGFIDSLINKIKSAGPVERPYEMRYARKPAEEPQIELGRKSIGPRESPRTPVKARPKSSHNNNDNIAKETNNPSPTIGCTSPEFFGFTDTVFKGNDVSALMPTPRVHKSTDTQSVFVSEELDTFMKENALDNVANVLIPSAKKPQDEALLTEDAEPPTMKVPQRPDSMERPRTLAEKQRILFEKRKDFRYLMIENESTIYHELRKRRKEGRHLDNSLLKGIINGSIPTTRDCWRAMCWLNTDRNRFFFQTIEIGEQSIKIFGGRGNNRSKIMCKVSANNKKEKEKIRKLKPIKCARTCPPLDKIKIRNFDDYYRVLTGEATQETKEEDNEPHRKINLMLDDAAHASTKPGPLCSKVARKRTSVDTEYGPFQSFRLPRVQLEVWPKLEQPLPEPIQPYLKFLLPHAHITDEWAKFAVCAVKATQPRRRNSRKYKRFEGDLGSFVFDIPYVNDQKRILVRRRRMHDHWETTPLQDDYSYKFVEDVDKSDADAVECADILSQMITSVAITANENRLIKHDPDIDYVGKLVPILPAVVSPQKALVKPKQSPSSEGAKTTKSKIMKELRRLNATIIDTSTPVETKDVEVCTNTFCRFGCVCESIKAENTISVHCQELACMFDCNCTTNSELKCASALNTSHSNISQLRAQATARLAKEEKDFTSTVVLSENDMFVLPNINGLGKRNKKKPKRYNECLLMDGTMDFVDLGDEAATEESAKCAVGYTAAGELERMRHARVALPKMTVLNGLEPLCMVHQLYRCFCRNQAISGEPFELIIGKKPVEEHPQVIPTHLGIAKQWDVIPPRKRQYTFEKGDISTELKRRSLGALMMNSSYDDPSACTAARTRSFAGRKYVSKQVLRSKRRYYNSTESPLLRKLLAKQRRCELHRETAPIEYIEIDDDEISNEGTASGTSQTTAPQAERPSQPTKRNPSNPVDTRYVQRLNQIVTRTMQTTRMNQTNDRKWTHPSQCLMDCRGWDHVVAAYQAQRIFIWLVRFDDEQQALLAVTGANEMPLIRKASSVSNISKADTNSLPMIAKMLKKGIMNASTKQMAVLVIGAISYWRIVSVVHSDRDYVENGVYVHPTPQTHPVLSEKIARLFTLLTTRTLQKRQQEQRQRPPTDESSSSSSSIVLKCTPNATAGPEKPDSNDADSSDNSRSSAASTATAESTPRKTTPVIVENPKQNEVFMKKRHSNVPISLAVPDDFDIPLLPIPNWAGQFWLMLKLEDDFTHIWFPSRRKFMSMKLIQFSLTVAKEKGKTVLLTQTSFHPQVYATPVAGDRIFIGPYTHKLDMDLALFRRFNNQMMLIERYEQEQSIKLAPRSIGFWLHYKAAPANEAIDNAEDSSNGPTEELLSMDIVPIDNIPNGLHMPNMPAKIQSFPKIQSVMACTPPVINAPNNQIKIQNVFSFKASSAPSTAQSVSIPATSGASVKPSATVNPIMVTANHSTQSRVMMPSLPTIQAVASLALGQQNSFGRPNETTATTTTVALPQIRPIPTASLTAQPMPQPSPQPNLRPILPKLQPAPTRFLVHNTRPNASAIIPVTLPSFSQNVTTASITAMTAVVQPSIQKTTVVSGLQIRPIQQLQTLTPTQMAALSTVQPTAQPTAQSTAQPTTLPIAQRTAQSKAKPQPPGHQKPRVLLLRKPDGKYFVGPAMQNGPLNTPTTPTAPNTSLSGARRSNPDWNQMKSNQIADLLNKRNSLGTATTVKKIVSPAKNVVPPSKPSILETNISSASATTAPAAGAAPLLPMVKNAGLASATTTVSSATKVENKKIHTFSIQARPAIKVLQQASTAVAGVSASASGSAASAKLPVKPSMPSKILNVELAAKVPLVVQQVPRTVTKPAEAKEPAASEPIEISDDEEEDSSDDKHKSDAAPTSKTSSEQQATSSSEKATEVTPRTKLPTSKPTLKPTSKPTPTPQSKQSNQQAAPVSQSTSQLPAVIIRKAAGSDEAKKKNLYPVPGFLISDNIPLGKMEAERYKDHVIIRIQGLDFRSKFSFENGDELPSADTYLDRYMRQRVFAFYPKDLHIKWRFVSETTPKHRYYKPFDTLDKNFAITHKKIIPLQSLSGLKKPLATNVDVAIGLLRLASFCMSGTDVRNATDDIELILERSEQFLARPTTTISEVTLEALSSLREKILKHRQLPIKPVIRTDGFKQNDAQAPNVLNRAKLIKRAASDASSSSNEASAAKKLCPIANSADPLQISYQDRPEQSNEPQIELMKNAVPIISSPIRKSYSGISSSDVITIDDDD